VCKSAEAVAVTQLIARLHGRKPLPLTSSIFGAETERLLHYADVSLGTDGKEKFVSSGPHEEPQTLVVIEPEDVWIGKGAIRACRS
jgi:hypothetical protein